MDVDSQPGGQTVTTYAPMTGIADGELRRLDPRVIPLDRVVGGIVTASVSVGLLIGAIIIWASGALDGWLTPLVFGAWVVMTAALAVLSYRWPPLHYKHTSYKLDALGIEIRTGVLWRTVLVVPRSRVQHIDVSQGPLERSYGLGTLVIYTAGTAHSQVSLPGLEHSMALWLRDHLLPSDEDDAI